MSQTDDDFWAEAFDEHPRVESGSGSSVEHFKWGWNAETGEATVWRVVGGPDGPPFHREHLTEAWGRPPSSAASDLVGIATRADDPVGADVTITPYYGKPVPVSVVSWFTAAFPSSAVHSIELRVPDA
jgi:hypothetical protein